ncbi:MAG: hypothetical protein JWN31_2059 [Frankiales bacterium]|nr:hypothetical protein [Frankiales bacterium]
MSIRRRALLPFVAAALMAASMPAFAVSDGSYDAHKQGCAGNADDSDRPQHTESHCYSATLQLSGAKHRYVLVGVPQTPDGTSANAVELCIDLTGTAMCVRVDANGFTQLPDRKGTPLDPEKGELHAYFGADDNLDSGEHDGSEAVATGPSDGGAIQANVVPLSAADWVARVLGGDTQYLLTHPLPGADAGAGGCADGICISVQTQRRIIYKAGAKHAKTRNAADYDGHTWDPPSCAGPTDRKKDCGGHSMAWWHQHNQTTYVEPGITIYEDPDPQGSPIGPYPLPALYIGTCGFVAGGGTAPAFPASPVTNKSGQLLVKTGC